MSQSLERALTSLMFIAEQPRTVRAIAERLDVHPTTALRILQILQKWRMVDKRPGGEFRLGSAVVDLGQRALESLDLREVAAPFMRKLNEATGETVHLAVLERDNVVYIDKVESQHPVRMYSRVGIVAPPHCTGVAKAILARLPRSEQVRLAERGGLRSYTPNTLTTTEALLADLAATRERGYSIDNQEHEVGIHCVAAPILNADGSVAGSVSVSAPAIRVSKRQLLSFVGALLDASQGITEALGHRTR